jgi:predicted homoserine dehydrogenase-like protein
MAVSARYARERGLVPLGLATGLRLRNGVGPDQVLGYGDVEAPEESSFAWKLRREQERAEAGAVIGGPA